MCKFSFQEAASCALCSILSASCTTFAVWMPEEDVQDFRHLRTDRISPQVVVLFLTSSKFSAIAWSGIANNRICDIQIYFAIPPNSAFYRPIGGIFVYISKI